VVLKRHFADLKMGAICENKKNLMKICVNGLEIFVELSGNQMPGHAFIDILVKSSKNEIQTIQFVHDHVLSQGLWRSCCCAKTEQNKWHWLKI
jgi:hypothetical protein